MLRNVHRCNQQLLHIERCSRGCAPISTTCGGAAAFAKADSITFQSKVMSKLIGHRVSGSKKRWYPSNESNTSNSSRQRNAEMFNNAHINKSTAGGKTTTRRMVVLNKLFMKHITDLLATGEASEAILGRGLQVTRVKIAPDFATINVYWLGRGEPLSDALLETELQRCSGVLRHELSQLMLMSEVPRVQFTREKRLSNINQVEDILRSIDFGATEEITDAVEGVERERENAIANLMQREFYGKNALQDASAHTAAESEAGEEHFPEMRHDVLGLDHRHIMSKLLTKMRKSQQAWDEHAQKVGTTGNEMTERGGKLERVQQKLAEAAEKAERFEKFLAKRREPKNTPERKRHDRASDWIDEDAEQAARDAAAEGMLSPAQRRLLEAEDYLDEDDNGKSEIVGK
ncbi:PREDICTED: uncharacterized protein LOC108383226 [Rhagoletis zephyria]|uniref:uncharacterized protein LOC108383226 n=1 Tax=Rhagoletis zephyria TaxID=28612 RepID=UPI0008117B8F|nr:PREDICTED: uncharacterized protein LOC108383226 [Rhagoletis zephyria]XP_036339199.1 uncharacterized protein LOC118748694 [Rhagoletis pomonella]